jgi:hypothetical protein
MAVLSGVAAVVVVTGSASAYWTTSGTATGHATTGQGKVVVSVAVFPTDGLLYPSNTFIGKLKLTLTANVKAKVTQIAQKAGTVTVTGAGPGGCDGSVITLQTTATNINLLANTPSTVEILNVVKMAASAAVGCQGASFTIPVTLTAQETP